jgi:hypothetical protein
MLRAYAPTFVAMIIPQPFGCEGPRIKPVLPPVNYKRLATNNDMQQDKLLEILQSLLLNGLARKAVHILEILRGLDKFAQVEIWGNWFERSTRAAGRHLTLFHSSWSMCCGGFMRMLIVVFGGGA